MTIELTNMQAFIIWLIIVGGCAGIIGYIIWNAVRENRNG